MPRVSFQVTATDGPARAGIIQTASGPVATPTFMPVGTQGTVKTLSQNDLSHLGYRLILCNTYHLFLRPGPELIEKAGGLAKFMGWDGAILTDSGGYQVMSLAGLRKMSEEGVEFQSHIDGDRHLLTPELAIEVQRRYGVDVSMALDECPPYPAERGQVENAVERTARWAERCAAAAGPEQSAFGIVQGGVYEDLRERSLTQITGIPFDGYAIGGVSVGEPAELQQPVVRQIAPLLPADKPRYLMGVGQPSDIMHAIGCGVDMFDCVLPTRGGRHNAVYTDEGRTDITSLRYETEFGPIDPDCDCAVCARYSAAYVRHLCRVKEPLGARLLTYHNLRYYKRLVEHAREAIQTGRYAEFAGRFMDGGEPGT